MSLRTSFLAGVLVAVLTGCGHGSDAPAVPRLEFGRSLAHVAGLPKLKEQLKALEARLAALETGN